jgi:Putative bacterial sensory transduction regulator
MTVAELISKEELTGQKLMEIFEAAYMDPHIDADGDVTVVLDGIKILVTADAPRSVLRLVALFGVKPGVNRYQMLELANRINDRLIMLRASYPTALPMPSLMLDHYLVTEAGLSGLEIVDETRRFRTVVASIPPLDVENILT